MKKILFVSLIFCLLLVVSFTCKKPVKPPEFKIDHFKVYKADTLKAVIPFEVWLWDQFDLTTPRPAYPLFIEYFANPVSKDSQRIIDPAAHLTWYRLKEDPLVKPRTVKITNQFGTFTWRLGKAVYLLVPTFKIEPGVPLPDTLNIDHFKCYEVIAPEVLQRKVTLFDQFDRRLNREEKAVVDRPLYLAVPVMKNGRPIKNRSDHLACYHINVAPDPFPPTPINVLLRNQFAKDSLTVRESYMLCVPSKKSLVKEGEE